MIDTEHTEHAPLAELYADRELPRLTATVTLSLTVPLAAVAPTVARLSATLRDAVADSMDGGNGWLGAANLSIYPVAEEGQDDDD